MAADVQQSASDVAILPSSIAQVKAATQAVHDEVVHTKTEITSRLERLAIELDGVMTSNFTAFNTVISKAVGRFEETKYPEPILPPTDESLITNDDSLRLPLGMSRVVRDVFRGVLAEFYVELNYETTKDSTTVVAVSSQCSPSTTPRVAGQHITTRRYHRRIGIITVESITTTFWKSSKDGERDNGVIATSTVTQTRLWLHPNPALIRLGTYCCFVQNGYLSLNSAPTPRLRAYRSIASTDPIVKACRMGDLQTVRFLIDTGEASPFDRIWGDNSLLDLILLQFIQSDDATLTHKLLAVFEDLVKCGLDPGEPRLNEDIYGRSPLGALVLVATKDSQKTDDALRLARIILECSIHDPVSDINLSAAVVIQNETAMLALLDTQDKWPITWPTAEHIRATHLEQANELQLEQLFNDRLTLRYYDLDYAIRDDIFEFASSRLSSLLQEPQYSHIDADIMLERCAFVREHTTVGGCLHVGSYTRNKRLATQFELLTAQTVRLCSQYTDSRLYEYCFSSSKVSWLSEATYFLQLLYSILLSAGIAEEVAKDICWVDRNASSPVQPGDTQEELGNNHSPVKRDEMLIFLCHDIHDSEGQFSSEMLPLSCHELLRSSTVSVDISTMSDDEHCSANGKKDVSYTFKQHEMDADEPYEASSLGCHMPSLDCECVPNAQKIESLTYTQETLLGDMRYSVQESAWPRASFPSTIQFFE